MENFQYNKLLKETISSESRFYEMEKKNNSNNQQKNQILKVKTCRIAKSERDVLQGRVKKY